MVRQRSKNRLPDPPNGIADEFYALVRIKLSGSRNKTHVPFLDEICERDTTILIFLCDTDHKTQVCSSKLLDGILITLLGEGTEFLFTFRSDKLVPADVAQVLI